MRAAPAAALEMPIERPIEVDHDPFAEPRIANESTTLPPVRRGLIQNRDLEALFPAHQRVVGPWRQGSGTYPVNPDYDDWLDLDQNAPGRGLHISPEQHQQNWDEAWNWVRGFSPEQAAAVDAYFAAHPETKPPAWEDEDRALRLPGAARYWYELSSRGMAAEAPHMPAEHILTGYNLVSGTSPQAEPEPNFKRALGTFAEHYQRLPIATDLITPGLVRRLAFAPEDPDAPKTGNFAGTFGYIGGAVPRAPLSTNDRQVADRLGISPEALAANPWLYAGVSRYFQNYRDAENSADPEIRAGRDNPYETWQLQAPGWVDTRNQKLGTKGIERNDDYLQVIGRLRPALEAAGIDTSPGLWSHEVLSDPRLPDLMSTSRQVYLQSPVMTLETGSTMTPEGRRAADLFNRLPAGDQVAFARNARADYEALQRRSLRELSSTHGGERPSVFENLAGAALGQRVAMPRFDPRAWGTYQDQNGVDQVSPNLRMPMWGLLKTNGPHGRGGERITLPDNVIRLMLGALGEATYQEAVPASRFRTIDPSVPDSGAPAPTYSVFLREHGREQTPIDQVHEIGRQLGAPLSISRGPNGTLVDIHPFAAQPLTEEAVAEATRRAVPADLDARVIARDYQSHYMMHPETIADPVVRADPTQSYQAAHDAFWEAARASDRPPADDRGRVRATYWDAERRLGDFTAAKAAARAIADDQRTRTQRWIDKYQPRLEAYLANPAGRGRLAPALPSGIPGLAGALASAAQFAQPPPATLPPGVAELANVVRPAAAPPPP